MRYLIAWIVLSLATVGCQLGIIGGDNPQALGCTDGGLTNSCVYDALRPSCDGCHGNGATRPYFQSLDQFESLTRNPSFIVAGHPESSYFVDLLAGDATGRRYTQMPTAGPSYASMSNTRLTMDQVRQWIRNMEPVPPSNVGDIRNEVSLTRRLSARQVINSLYAQLGLSRDDFFTENFGYLYTNAEKYPALSMDEMPSIYYSADPDAAYGRWSLLGGAHWTQKQEGNTELTPVFLHTIRQMSQAYCRKSISDSTNNSLFFTANRSHTSAANATEILENIRFMMIWMHGELVETEVQMLFNDVFQYYEANENTESAWVAVCAALIQHPAWVTL